MSHKEKKKVVIEGEEMDFKQEEEPKETVEEPCEEPAGQPEEPDETEALKEELAKLKNEYYRVFADTENLKKRLQAEAEQTKKYRIQSFAKEVLPVIDNLERALSQETTDENLKKGVQMTYDQLMHALELEGVVAMDCLNKPFDPNFHHAIMQEPVEGVESNTVVEVFQKGYMLKDRILRAALVKVSE